LHLINNKGIKNKIIEFFIIMSKLSFFILVVAIMIAIIPLYYKLDKVKEIIGWDNKIDDNYQDKAMYILNKKNNTLEEEFKLKYIDLKNELINYRNNNTYLKYEREAIEKIKELEIEKKIFEDFEKNINEKNQKDFQEEELKNLTDLIDRYILSEN
jgi:hypothetical protein